MIEILLKKSIRKSIRKSIHKSMHKFACMVMVFTLVVCSTLVCDFTSKTQVLAAGKMVDAKAGQLKVKGTKLCDKKGKPVQLRGVSTHGLSWFPGFVNDKGIGELHDKWGANVIRLAMFTADYNGYCTGDKANQKTLKKLLKNGVKYATKHNMYVIIDWHILSDSNPNTYKAQAKKFFGEMSKEFAKNTNVIYEICNEPNGETSWKEIKAYAESVIPVIRKNDKDAIVIVGTPNWSQYVNEAAAAPIKKYDNVMYSLHFYAATHQDDLRKTMQTAIDNGLPIFVTEFGICDASGDGAINKDQANKWIKILDKNKVSYVAWNLSNKSETSALIKDSCTKTSGFTKQDLSDSGKWLYSVLRKRSGLQ